MVQPYSGQLRYVWDPAAGAYRDVYTGALVGTSIPQVADNETTFDGGDYAPVGEYAPGSTQAPERPGYLDTLTPTGNGQASTPGGQPVPADLGYITHWNPDSGPQGQGAYELNPQNPATGGPYTGMGALEAGIDVIRPINPDGSYADGSSIPTTNLPASTGGTSGGGYSGGYSGGSSGGYSSGGGYSSSRGGYGGGYSSGGSSRSYDGGGGYSSDPMSNIPRYADGSLHPAVSGEPLVPGGQFNDGSSGGGVADYYSDGYGTADAGWKKKRDRYNDRSKPNFFSARLGWNDPNAYKKERARNLRYGILDRVDQSIAEAMAPGGGGGMMGAPMGGAPMTGGTTPGALPGGSGMGPTATRSMRGWAGRQNFTPAGLQDIYYNPQWLYPSINPGLKPGTGMFNQVDDLLSPNLQSLWSGSAGARTRAGTGVDHYANWINKVVKEYTTPGGSLLNANKLIRGLTTPRRGSTQWQALQGQTVGEQTYNLTNQIGAVAATTMNPMAASATMSYLDTLMNTAGAKNLTRGPNRQVNPAKHVARHLFD